MTREEVKSILAAYRPGTEDERDPVFAQALATARADAELKAWLDDSIAFDATVKTGLARIIAPATVRDAILAEHKIVRPVAWWHRRMSAPQFAAAAAVIITGLAFMFWQGRKPAGFGEFRREIADEAWGASPHMQLAATNMADLRRKLDNVGVSSRFTVPSVLAQSQVRGCSLLHWRGHEMPVICFNSENQHLHLVVVDRTLFPDAPGRPEMDDWDAWRTASWSKDDFSFVLTGLNTPNFVKKFRKSKRWDWEG